MFEDILRVKINACGNQISLEYIFIGFDSNGPNHMQIYQIVIYSN